MKGDRVEVVIDAGGDIRTYEIEATRAGRRVEVRTGRGVVEVTEVDPRRAPPSGRRDSCPHGCWHWWSIRLHVRSHPTTQNR
jgi:hypothetical protein